MRATDLAALAAGGIGMVPVRRKPRVAFIPTGSELVPAGIAPRRGQNVDGNSIMVAQMLREYGAEPLIFPICYDDPKTLSEAFENALKQADLVVINGGSAVGSEDYNVQLIEKRGTVIHHYIAAVPGRPMMLAVCDGKPVVDLPGPTLAAYYGTQWCLQAVVARILGIPVRVPYTVQAKAAKAVKCPPMMANIQRINLTTDDQGQYIAHFVNGRADGIAAAMTSNAQRISPLGEKEIADGQMIEVEILRGKEVLG